MVFRPIIRFSTGARFCVSTKNCSQNFEKRGKKAPKTKVNEVDIGFRFINTFHVTSSVFFINKYILSSAEGNKKGTKTTLSDRPFFSPFATRFFAPFAARFFHPASVGLPYFAVDHVAVAVALLHLALALAAVGHVDAAVGLLHLALAAHGTLVVAANGKEELVAAYDEIEAGHDASRQRYICWKF